MSRGSAARPRGKARRLRAGYSLVAVLVAMTLLVVGLMSLAGANVSTTRFQGLAQNRTHAIIIARGYLEELRMRDPWSVTSEAATTVGPDGTPVAGGAFTRTVVVTELRTNLLEATVSVTYPQGASPITLATRVFRGAQTQ
jgi:Tfp pilus assembly protein PilV